MKRNELRLCIVKIGEETHKGYFHTWGIESYVTSGYLVGTVAGQVSNLYGVIEYEDGSIHKIDPVCITFTDGNIDTDIT